MSDSVENNDTPVVNEPSPIEQEARAAGWVPKDEYHGDEHKWVDAPEFVRRGELFDKINRQGSELKEVRKALEALKAHHHTVKETAYKEALASLRKEKREAFDDGDADKIIQIEEKIDAVKEDQRQFEAQRQAEATQAARGEAHPEFQAWTNRNQWYNDSKPMRAFADTLGAELHGQGYSPAEVLKKVEVEIRKEFPHKFENPNRNKPGAVEAGGKPANRKPADHFELSDTERAIMNRFVRQGVMTQEQYIADLKKTRN